MKRKYSSLIFKSCYLKGYPAKDDSWEPATNFTEETLRIDSVDLEWISFLLYQDIQKVKAIALTIGFLKSRVVLHILVYAKFY